jgi:hypothetical protein
VEILKGLSAEKFEEHVEILKGLFKEYNEDEIDNWLVSY